MQRSSPHACYKPRPSHFSLFDRRIIFGEEYRSQSSSVCNLRHSSVTSTLLDPKIFLSTLLSLPQCERPNFTPIYNRRQNHNSVHLDLYIFGYKSGRQQILHRKAPNNPRLQSALVFPVSGMLICWGSFKIPELFYLFKWFIAYFYAVFLFCILFTRLDFPHFWGKCELFTCNAIALIGLPFSVIYPPCEILIRRQVVRYEM